MWPRENDGRGGRSHALIDTLDRVLEKGVVLPYEARALRPPERSEGRMVIVSVEVFLEGGAEED